MLGGGIPAAVQLTRKLPVPSSVTTPLPFGVMTVGGTEKFNGYNNTSYYIIPYTMYSAIIVASCTIY